MSKYDVIALGELLIDFTPAGKSKSLNNLFEMNPGGAPANVLTAIATLGGKCAFIGKVGNDQFGKFLSDTLKSYKIDCSNLKFSHKEATTLAFVHLDDKGDRSFSFYRNPGADTQLNSDEIDYTLIDNSKIFHFGSLLLTDNPSKEATFKAVKYAKEKGKIVSYDPNWSPMLWNNKEEGRELIIKCLPYTDILKISEEEMELITNDTDIEKGSKQLVDSGIKIVLVTLGAKGCYYRTSKYSGHKNTYDTKVVDTTGAGDAFTGSFLYNICKDNIDIMDITKNQIEHYVDFSNGVGALCATKKGGIPSMPSIDEVHNLIKKVPKLKYHL